MGRRRRITVGSINDTHTIRNIPQQMLGWLFCRGDYYVPLTREEVLDHATKCWRFRGYMTIPAVYDSIQDMADERFYKGCVNRAARRALDARVRKHPAGRSGVWEEIK